MASHQLGEVSSITLFHRRGNRGSGQISNWPQVTHVVKGRARNSNRSVKAVYLKCSHVFNRNVYGEASSQLFWKLKKTLVYRMYLEIVTTLSDNTVREFQC